MLDNIAFNEIATTFIGGLITLFFAGFVWIIKSAYERHKKEIFALVKLERASVINFESVRDNLEFIRQWIEGSKNYRPFSYDFSGYILFEEEAYNLRNLKTINVILPVFYRLNRSDKDLKNMYDGYWNAIYKIDLIEDEKLREENLKALFRNVKTQIESIAPNYDILQEDLKKVIACIRANSRVNKYSIFGIVDFFFRDIWPKVNDEMINKEIEKLKKEINEKIKKQIFKN